MDKTIVAGGEPGCWLLQVCACVCIQIQIYVNILMNVCACATFTLFGIKCAHSRRVKQSNGQVALANHMCMLFWCMCVCMFKCMYVLFMAGPWCWRRRHAYLFASILR